MRQLTEGQREAVLQLIDGVQQLRITSERDYLSAVSQASKCLDANQWDLQLATLSFRPVQPLAGAFLGDLTATRLPGDRDAVAALSNVVATAMGVPHAAHPIQGAGGGTSEPEPFDHLSILCAAARDVPCADGGCLLCKLRTECPELLDRVQLQHYTLAKSRRLRHHHACASAKHDHGDCSTWTGSGGTKNAEVDCGVCGMDLNGRKVYTMTVEGVRLACCQICDRNAKRCALGEAAWQPLHQERLRRQRQRWRQRRLAQRVDAVDLNWRGRPPWQGACPAANPQMVRGFHVMHRLRELHQYDTPVHGVLYDGICEGNPAVLRTGASDHHRLTTENTTSGDVHRSLRDFFKYVDEQALVCAIRNMGLTPAFRIGHNVSALDISSVMQSIATAIEHNKNDVGCFIFNECLPQKAGKASGGQEHMGSTGAGDGEEGVKGCDLTVLLRQAVPHINARRTCSTR
jgi:hypothetical protein